MRSGARIGGLVAAVAGVCVSGVGVGVASAALSSHIAGFRTYVAPVSAATTFTVPSANCAPVPSGAFQAVALGTELYRPALAGATNSTGVFVAVVCTGPGSATYEAVAQINGSQQSSSLTILPGDSVTTSAVENVSGTTLTISDASDSAGAPETFTGPGGTALWAGVGAIATNCLSVFGACSPVPELSSSVPFTGSTLNGKGLLAALAFRANLTSQAGTAELQTSPMGADRRSFTTTWVSSCGAGTSRC